MKKCVVRRGLGGWVGGGGIMTFMLQLRTWFRYLVDATSRYALQM